MSKPHQEAFTERRRKSHVRRVFWILGDHDKRLQQLAEVKGWINTTGRKTGKPNMQQALNHVISAGLTALEGK